MKICLIAPHGQGKESNRGGILFNEGDMSFVSIDILAEELRKYDCDVQVLHEKQGKKYPTFEEMENFVAGCDLQINWHSNAFNGSVRGSEIYLALRSKKYEGLAKILVKNIATILGTNNRGVKYKEYHGMDWYAELRNTAKNAMIIECCFHDNREDAKAYINNQVKMMKQVAKDIASYYNLKPAKTKGQILYRVYEQVGAYKNKSGAEKHRNDLIKKGKNAIIQEITL